MNPSRDALQASYAFCRRISRRSGSNFYLGFLLLPRDKRRAMDALYAFMRYSDDLVDVAIPSGLGELSHQLLNQRREHLQRWRELLHNSFTPGAGVFADPGNQFQALLPGALSNAALILPALVHCVQQFHIPVEYLFAVLDGVEMDLHKRRYETFAELQLYCQRVASAVGLACIHIWGFRGRDTAQSNAAFELARQAGIALQLTNILRDLKADAHADRIYLPLGDIRACGYSVEELKEGVVNGPFLRLMDLQIRRTREFYQEGYKLMEYLQRDGRRIFGLMMSTYSRLLKKIASRPSAVFSQPIRLGKLHRLSLLALWTLLPSVMRKKMR